MGCRCSKGKYIGGAYVISESSDRRAPICHVTTTSSVYHVVSIKNIRGHLLTKFDCVGEIRDHVARVIEFVPVQPTDTDILWTASVGPIPDQGTFAFNHVPIKAISAGQNHNSTDLVSAEVKMDWLSVGENHQDVIHIDVSA